MHFIKTLSTFLVAATATTASPLATGHVALAKRDGNGDGGAGAFINAAKDVAFTSVAGTVTMPDISKAKQNDIVSYWVGIDGINTDRVIQAGFDATKGSGDSATYQAFYEWFPNAATPIATSDFAVSKDDVVTVTVTTKQFGTAAVAIFENKSTGKTFTTPEFNSPDADDDATGINAQWIVEQPSSRTLADFGEIVFSDCFAADKNGKQYDLKGGNGINLVLSGKTLAKGSIKGNNEVDVKYTA